MYKEKRFLLKIKFNSKTIIIILNFDNCFPKWFQRMSLEFNETFLMGDLFCRSQVDGLKNKSILAREKLEIHFPHWQTPKTSNKTCCRDFSGIMHYETLINIKCFIHYQLYLLEFRWIIKGTKFLRNHNWWQINSIVFSLSSISWKFRILQFISYHWYSNLERTWIG